jgi:hypothetical protein
MPQLVKGGKYAFGWSKVGPDGEIAIPPEAVAEYKLNSAKVILISGSKTSGGFSVTSLQALQASQLGTVLERHPGLSSFELPEGTVVVDGSRLLCWVGQQCGSIKVPAETLERYGIQPGDRLLAIRGSHLGIGFAVKGPIVKEANRHPELSVFE